MEPFSKLRHGVDPARLSDRELSLLRAREIGFVFQTFNLIPVLTAFENVELPLLLTRLNARERRRQVQLALELVGLAQKVKVVKLHPGLDSAPERRVGDAEPLRPQPDLRDGFFAALKLGG